VDVDLSDGDESTEDARSGDDVDGDDFDDDTDVISFNRKLRPTSAVSNKITATTIAEHVKHYEVSVLFPLGAGAAVNLASRVSASAAADLQHEAVVAIAALTPPKHTAAALASAEDERQHGVESADADEEADGAPHAVATKGPTGPDPLHLLAVFGPANFLPPSVRFDRIMVAPMPATPLQAPTPPVASAASAVGTPATAQVAESTKIKGGKHTPDHGTPPVAADTKIRHPNARASPAVVASFCDVPSGWPAIAVGRAHSVLTRALTDRVQLVRVMPVYGPQPAASTASASASRAAAPSASSPSGDTALHHQLWPSPEVLTWRLTSPPPVPTCLWVCVRTAAAAATAGRAVDRGPPQHTVEAAAFVELWGASHAGLRRFADGGIVHAVVRIIRFTDQIYLLMCLALFDQVWDAAKMGGRPHARENIIPLVIAHMMQRHLNVSSRVIKSSSY
jgi:hypothetical protein